jgi:hypothetical protein
MITSSGIQRGMRTAITLTAPFRTAAIHQGFHRSDDLGRLRRAGTVLIVFPEASIATLNIA